MKWTDQGECFPVLKHVPRWVGRSIFVSMPTAVFRFAARKAVPVAKFALVACLVLALIDGAATFILGRKVKAEIDALRTKGEWVAISQLASPDLPDDRNGALLYAQAFRFMEDESLKDLDKLRRSADEPVAATPAALPTPYTDLDELDRFLHLYRQSGEKWRWDQAAQIVRRYRKAMQLAVKAADRPECRFAIYPNADGSFNFDHANGLDQLINLFIADAIINAKAGRMDEAIDSLGSAFRLTESLKDEPRAMFQMIRSGRVTALSGTLGQVMRYGRINESQARRLSTVLAGIDPASGYEAAMKGERAWGLHAYECLRDGRMAVQELVFPEDSSEPGLASMCCRLIGSYAGRSILYADQLEYIKIANHGVDHAGLTCRELAAKHMHDRMPARYAVVATVTSQSLLYSRARIDTGTTAVCLSRTALGLEAYRDRYGSYPASLSDLKKRMGWDTPKDPFSGKDFAYKRQADSFVLYSIGVNGRDDGGRSRDWVPRDQADDIPWGLHG